MKYRMVTPDGGKIAVSLNGKDRHYLDPAVEYDPDNVPLHRQLLERYPSFFVSVGDVEAATAAPGEKRAAKRS